MWTEEYSHTLEKRLRKNKNGEMNDEGFLRILFAEFYELIKLNLVFIVFCIPIVTIPAALLSLDTSTLKMRKGVYMSLRDDFVNVFRGNFKRTIAPGLVYFLITAGVFMSVLLYSSLAAQYSKIFYVLTAFGIVILIFILMYGSIFFKVLGITDLGSRETFKSSFSILRESLPKSLIPFFINLAIALIVVLINPASLIFLLFIGFSFMSFISAYFLLPHFERFF